MMPDIAERIVSISFVEKTEKCMSVIRLGCCQTYFHKEIYFLLSLTLSTL
jgi:hypothetical protein